MTQHHTYSMGQMLVINAPTSFTAIWTIIKPWLSPRTLEKISVLGTDQYHAVLQDLVPPENLPTFLGGTCTCDSARGGCTLSNAGPWMVGRAERRASWLRGEIAAPGVPWPPPHKPKTQTQTQTQNQKVQANGNGERHAEVQVEGGSCTATATTTPSPSWGRASVVGLPLPLPHSTVPAPVLVV